MAGNRAKVEQGKLGGTGKQSVLPSGAAGRSTSIWLRAGRAMHEARLQDGRPLGVLLQQALSSALKLVFMIGGLVVFFSVVLELLSVTNVLTVAYTAAGALLHTASIPPALAQAIVNGLFEVTLGAKAAGGAGVSVPLVHKAAVAAFVVSWAGLSVHAQIASLLTGTGLRYWPFALARLLHGVLAFGLVYALWRPLGSLRPAAALPTTMPTAPPAAPDAADLFVRAVPYSLAAALLTLLLIPLLYTIYAVLSYCFRKLF